MSNSWARTRRRNGAPVAAPRGLPGLSRACLPRANPPRPAAPRPSPQKQAPRPPRPPETLRNASAVPQRPRWPASPQGLPGTEQPLSRGLALLSVAPDLNLRFLARQDWPPGSGGPHGFASLRIRVGHELSTSRGRFSAGEHGPSLSCLVLGVWGRNSSPVVEIATTTSDHCPF